MADANSCPTGEVAVGKVKPKGITRPGHTAHRTDGAAGCLSEVWKPGETALIGARATPLAVKLCRVIPIGVQIESTDLQHLCHLAATLVTLHVDDKVDECSDLRLNHTIRQVHVGAQRESAESRECLSRRIGMERGQRACVPGIQRIQEIERFRPLALRQ